MQGAKCSGCRSYREDLVRRSAPVLLGERRTDFIVQRFTPELYSLSVDS